MFVSIHRYVDFINVMAYDYNGPWSVVTGFTGPLYSRNSNPAFNKQLSQVIDNTKNDSFQILQD